MKRSSTNKKPFSKSYRSYDDSNSQILRRQALVDWILRLQIFTCNLAIAVRNVKNAAMLTDQYQMKPLPSDLKRL